MAATVLIEGIEKAGSTDRDEIQKALTTTDIKDHILPQDAIVFDEKGQNINARAVLNQIIDGATYIVGPEEYKVEEPIYPQN